MVDNDCSAELRIFVVAPGDDIRLVEGLEDSN
jgi:hypothetical protein